jgi:hypothetical protein
VPSFCSSRRFEGVRVLFLTSYARSSGPFTQGVH